MIDMEAQEPIQQENVDLEIVSDDEPEKETEFLSSQISVGSKNLALLGN